MCLNSRWCQRSTNLDPNEGGGVDPERRARKVRLWQPGTISAPSAVQRSGIESWTWDQQCINGVLVACPVSVPLLWSHGDIPDITARTFKACTVLACYIWTPHYNYSSSVS